MPAFHPERLTAEARTRLERVFRVAVGVVTTLGIVAPAVTQAEVVKTLINYIMLGLAFFLNWMIEFVGFLVLMLVNVVIDVAQYNSFVTAKPVEAGWPLVRDVVNMFFIVILLVTAFSTIIQWHKFDYKKILPKLLLMAVLVNFSKTIIGLLIDFSQILMLTFVNGFKAAAAGNFISALKLDKVMSLRTNRENPDAQVDDPELLKLVMAMFLGLFFLGTTVVMLLIMIVYLLVRVIGLWIALIMSPAAFFASAIADTPLKDKLSAVMGTYWTRLGAMLSGGPIMAFFLWLTLATVQGGGLTGFNVSAASNKAEEQQVQSFFSSAVGNVEDVSTYFVAIIMLLMGVEAAVSISGQVSKSLGGAAAGISSAGLAATRFATYGGLAAGAAYAARGVRRGTGYVAGGVGRAVESRTNLSGGVGRGLQAVGAATGIAAIGRAGGALRKRRVTERTAYEKELGAATEGMTIDQRIGALSKYANSTNRDKARAAQLMMGKLQASPDGIEATRKSYTAKGSAAGLAGEQLKGYAEHGARGDAASRLDEISALGKETNDQDLLKFAREERIKRPDLFAQNTEGNKSLTDHVEKLMDDGDANDFMKKLDSRAYQDPRVMDSIIKHSGMMKDDGTLDQNNVWYKGLVEKGGMRGNLFKQRVADLAAGATEGGTYVKTAGGYSLVGAAAITAAGTAVSGEAPAGAEKVARQRREAEITAGKSVLGRDRAANASPESLQPTQLNLMAAGANLTEVYQMDQNGTFANDAERGNFNVNVNNAMEAAKGGDLTVVQNMDLTALNQNTGGKNEARTAFVQNTSTEALQGAASAAAGNPSAMRAVADIARVVETEGKRVESSIDAFNAKSQKTFNDNRKKLGLDAATEGFEHIDKKEVEAAAKSGDAAALQRALGASGVNVDMADAQALAKKTAIAEDPELSALRRHSSSRTAAAAARVKQGAVGAARGAASSVRTAAAGAIAGAATAVSAEGRQARAERNLERRAARTELRGGGPDTTGLPGDRTPPPPPRPPRT